MKSKNGKSAARESYSIHRDVERLASVVLSQYDGKWMTLGELQKTLGVDHARAKAVFKELDRNGRIRAGASMRLSDADKKFEICAQKPPLPSAPDGETPAEAAKRKKMEYMFRLHGHGTCFRCGGEVPGRSQMNLAKRGHTKEDCDLQIFQKIQSS
ncbi:MAG: hypothetical protein BWY99_02632 [Synergistetes bacterium ADurb.BinA166]|nr:MAG: hypothetical protein BWY99_02632 [Synergistetes bacterium ADurb.BinA166]